MTVVDLLFGLALVVAYVLACMFVGTVILIIRDELDYRRWERGDD